MKLNDIKYVHTLCRRVAVHISSYRTLLLAFSGGLDSTVLLDILTTLRDNDEFLDIVDLLSLRAVYVNHRFSRYADRWAVHCAHECYQRNVTFITTEIIIDKFPNGLEAAARSARYEALAAIMKDDEVLITAQHQDDQVETIMLALKRGSGPAGLAAMAINIPFRGHRLVRPLLECSRAELEVYARTRTLCWIEDDSNNDLRFDRNFLRLKILPLLQQRWPQFSMVAARSAQLCNEQELLLDELLAETLKTLILPNGSLYLTTLTAMSNIRRAAILRRWLASHGIKMPSRQQLSRLWQEVALSRRDAVAQIQLDDKQVRRFRNCLYVLPKLPSLPNILTIIPWPLKSKKLRLPTGLGIIYRHQDKYISISQQIIANIPLISCNIFNKNLNVDTTINTTKKIVVDTDGVISTLLSETVVRAPRPNELVSIRFGPVRGMLYITGRRRGRKLKKIWQELAVPPWRRSRTPLLFYNEQLIAAIGIFITWEGAIQKSEEQWHLFWQADSINEKHLY